MKLIVSLVVSILLFIFNVVPSHAIPAFTRANNVECSTCHTVFPELNEYGEAFLKNGYVYFGKGKKKSVDKAKVVPDVIEEKPAAAQGGNNIVKGDGDTELLNKLKSGIMASGEVQEAGGASVSTHNANAEANHVSAVGEPKSEGVALSGVPEQLPISFTANIHGTYDRNSVNELDLSTRSLKLNAGGNFKEKAGFFGTYLLYTENVSGIANTAQNPTNTKSDIGELFFVLRHVGDSSVNLKVGRFQPKLGLWKSNNKLSTTNSYATYSYTVGSSLFKFEQPQDAVEANMIVANRFFVAGGIVNRKDQNTKEWYVHTSVKIGGADYLVNEPEIDLNKEESIFDFLTLTVGGYGYVGTNGDPNTVAGMSPRQNEFYRAGMDIDLLYKLYRLKLSGVVGNDDSPNLVYAPLKSYVAAIEGQYTILQNLIGSVRFEYQDDGASISRCYIPTVAYSPMENIKVAAEYKHRSGIIYSGAVHKEIDDKIGTLGVTFSF